MNHRKSIPGQRSEEWFSEHGRRIDPVLVSAFWTFEPAACGPVFPGLMAHKQQSIDIVMGIFPSILMKDAALLGQAHGCEAIILGDDKIAILNPVYQCIVHTVSPFVKDQCL